jgi:hypothetical protein
VARRRGGLLTASLCALLGATAGCADDPAPPPPPADESSPVGPPCEEPAPPPAGQVLGWADVDGDGRAELWVQTDQAASALVVALYTYDDRCRPVRITLDGLPFEHPVGGSVATTSGLRCVDEDAESLVLHSASSVDGERYEAEERALRLEGSELVEVRSATAEISSADPAFPRYGTFECGELLL